MSSSSQVSPVAVTFVDEQNASAYDCGICLQKLREPVAVCDDHIFCESCIHQLILSHQSSSFPCPTCRVECHPSRVHRVQFIVRRMNELQVRCPNFEITQQKALYMSQRNQNDPRIQHGRNQRNARDAPNEQRARSRSRSRERNENRNQADDQEHVNGNENEIKNNEEEKLCQWTGNLSDLQAHVDTCDLHMAQCEHCRNWMMRSELPGHLNHCSHVLIPCRLCRKAVRRAQMNAHIGHRCSNQIVPCQLCGERMIRKRLRLHLNNSCLEKVVRCKYTDYGCPFRMKRSELAQHESNMVSEHLGMMESAHAELKDGNDQLEDRLEEMEQNQEDMQEKVDELNDEINDMKKDAQDHEERISQLSAVLEHIIERKY